MVASARVDTPRPGVLPAPEKPITAVHSERGSAHDREGRTRRAAPICADAIDNKGMITKPVVTPAPRAARMVHSRHDAGSAPSGNSGSSPRRSSNNDESGSPHDKEDAEWLDTSPCG